MIEFDVDMGYLLEDDELDCVILNDENGEHEPMEFVPKAGNGTCEWVLEHSGTLYDKWRCSKCGYLFVESRTDQGIKEDFEPNFCPNCGKAVKR